MPQKKSTNNLPGLNDWTAHYSVTFLGGIQYSVHTFYANIIQCLNSLIRHVNLPCRRRAHAEFTESKCYQSCHQKSPNAAIYNCIMPSTRTSILSLGLSKHKIVTMALLWLDLMKCGNTNNGSHVEHLLCVPSTVLSAFHDNIVNPPNTWWVGTVITPISRSTKRWSTMP